MGRRSRQQRQQHQKLLPPQLEDPASLFPWCSWCGKVDHRWRSCPDGPPADWCGRCEVDGHNWAGCPHNPDQEQLQTPSSAATPPLPTSPPSPPSQEIWDWLMHPEADLFHDLPIAINTLWRRDGGRWEKWEAEHHPASFAELALMVVNYLAVDMGDAPFKTQRQDSKSSLKKELNSQQGVILYYYVLPQRPPVLLIFFIYYVRHRPPECVRNQDFSLRTSSCLLPRIRHDSRIPLRSTRPCSRSLRLARLSSSAVDVTQQPQTASKNNKLSPSKAAS
ncbi:UNVERIFIED_CONTAM: hypothetical protein FKN15_027221 [Acipenser sinensis]